MTFDQLVHEDPMTWPVNLQAEFLAEAARGIHAIGTVVLGCFNAVPQMKSALGVDYRRLKVYLKCGHICARGYRKSLATIHEVLDYNGLLGSGQTVFDGLAYEIQIAIRFSQMLEAVFGEDWTLDQFTPDNIAAYLNLLDESPTAAKH